MASKEIPISRVCRHACCDVCSKELCIAPRYNLPSCPDEFQAPWDVDAATMKYLLHTVCSPECEAMLRLGAPVWWLAQEANE